MSGAHGGRWFKSAVAVAPWGLRLILWSANLPGLVLAQVRPGPFTAPPRSVRSRTIDQQHLRLELQFNPAQREMRGRAVHRLKLLKPTAVVELDAQAMTIGRVTVAGESLADKPTEVATQHAAEKLSIPLPREMPAGSVLNVVVEYTVSNPTEGLHFVTPDPHEPGAQSMLWTQSEPESARCWFPCLDSPTDRLTSEIVATVPAEWVVLSNGTLQGDPTRQGANRTWHWKQDQTHVPYLLSVVAGDFEVLEQEWDGIPVQSYVPRGRLADARRSFEKTPAMMKYFSEQIGFRYPWPKYAQICVDEYNWGGMEHTSATTLNLETLHDARAHEDVSSIGLVAHELAHQWWGDLVTCKDWGELWLNEGFATYFATLWTEHDQGMDEASWERWNEAAGYRGEDAGYRRSIVNYRYGRPEQMFDSHSYPKGGRVLHMLRHELGDELFWRSLNLYLTAHQYRTVETANLRIAIEEASGESLNWFFDQWLYRAGHPEFQVDWRWDEERKTAVVTVRQTQNVDAETPLFRTSANIELGHGEHAEVRRVHLTKAEETLHFPCDQRPTRVCFDPADWILKTLKTSQPVEELLDCLRHSAHVPCRAHAVAELGRQTDRPEVAAALLETVRADRFWGVRQEAVKQVAKLGGDPARAALFAVAQQDSKASVRREAVTALGGFAHADTPGLLRDRIANDRSYQVVAEALRKLLQVDRANCLADLREAFAQTSHGEVILRAVCDGLVELKDPDLDERVTAELAEAISPTRRVVLLGALARLNPDDPEALRRLHAQLQSKRREVRRAALDSVVAVGSPTSVDVLAARRAQEVSPRAVRAYDEAINRLKEKVQSGERSKAELESLRKKYEAVEQRLKELEAKSQK
ncbi:MAG: M1 family aminopeptidase [Planctomycetaceae bacterium]